MTTYLYPQSLPTVYDQLISIVNNIFAVNSQTIELMDNFSANPSYVFVGALRQTMHNCCDILDAALYLYGLTVATTNLQTVESISLNISVQDTEYLNTRAAGMGNTINYIQNKIVAPIRDISMLIAGNAMVGDPGWLEYLAQFSQETPPSNVTLTSDVYSVSSDEVGAWGRIIDALNNSGVSFPDSILDTLSEMANIQSAATNFGSSYIGLSTNLPVSTQWNYTITNVVYQDLASVYFNNPSNATIQAAMVLRYSLKQTELACAELLIAFMNQLSSGVKTVQLLENQSLMDFANKNLGDYTQWEAVALANGLLPPYISSNPASNLANPGMNLVLPTSTPTGSAGSYITNFLGSDLNFGIPQEEMPPWTGDFEIVNGYTNLRYALARRILTPVGSFIYHPTYGSLVSTYLGQPMSVGTIALILAYAETAFLSDPRVAAISSLAANLTSNTTISLAASVEAAGGPSKSTTVDVVLHPGAITQSGK